MSEMSQSEPMAATSSPTKKWYGQPPPLELVKNSSSLRLLSQGAEGRVWLVSLEFHAAGTSGSSSLDSTSSNPRCNDAGGDTTSNKHKGTIHVGSSIHVPKIPSMNHFPSPLHPSDASGSFKVICKERFPKRYRHPQLDASLTKSRTKAEARCLIRCQRGGIPCPNVLGIAHWSNVDENSANLRGKESGDNAIDETGNIAACLFLEYIDGCTVRQYLERRSTEAISCGDTLEGDATPISKRQKQVFEVKGVGVHKRGRDATVIDTLTLTVAHSLGTLVGKMHAAGVIHGDLTTSNVMLRNPPWTCNECNQQNEWEPQLSLIDFGLATSTSSVLTNAKSNKQFSQKQNKQHFHSEEKAVDLYVLERAFLSTHPESDMLVQEVWKGYNSYFNDLDRVDGEEELQNDENGMKVEMSTGVGVHGQVAIAVMNRLEEVRKRGRKRECFG